MQFLLELMSALVDAPTNNVVLSSAKLLLRDSSRCHEVLQYLISSLESRTSPLSHDEFLPYKHLLYVFTEIFRLSTNDELVAPESDAYSTQFRTHFPWVSQFIYSLSGIDDRDDVVNLVSSWKESGYVSSLEFDVIMHADLYNFNDFKTVDIERVGAGSLCAILTAHMRLSLGDYKETLFRNVGDVSAAFRRIESRADTDVEDFIRNFS